MSSAKIKNDAVIASKIEPGPVSGAKIAAAAVGNGQTQLVKVFKAGGRSGCR